MATPSDLWRWNGTNDRWEGSYGRFIEPTTGNEPPPTLFGGSYSTKQGVDNSIYQGRGSVARIFFPGQDVSGRSIANHNAVQAAVADGVTALVVSAKDRDASRIDALLKTWPEQITERYFCYWHEPENDTGVQTAAQWRQRFTDLVPIIKGNGVTTVSITMGWTYYSGSGRDPNDWTLDPDLVDVFATDGYYTTYEPVDFFQRYTSHAKSRGHTRVGIGETGAWATTADRLALTQTYRGIIDNMWANEGLRMDFACYWNDYDVTDNVIHGDSRMLSPSVYYQGDWQKRTTPTPADWDTAVADAWFGPL